jgi:maleylacetoacetate isomerase/maleylpyruvate isomerase
MAEGDMQLFSYWRSSAAYRVRLALAWKGLEAEIVPVDLRLGVQSGEPYLALNRQGLVPSLRDGEVLLSQSLAIIEYLEETRPEPPLLPADAVGRARVRAAAQIVAADIHPINNLRVLKYLKDPLGQDQAAIDTWARHWITAGFAALEAFAEQHGGRFLYGNHVTMADICLLPQLYNARRVSTDLAPFPRLLAVESALSGLENLALAHPEQQPDAG